MFINDIYVSPLNYFNSMIKLELKYFWKSFSLIFTKFVSLQAQKMETDYDEEGDPINTFVWVDIDPSFPWCDSYYVCALFSNGKHLPLPLVLKNKKDRYGNYFYLQGMVLSIYRKTVLKNAFNACMKYIAVDKY